MYDDYFRKALELQQAGRPFATATVVRAEKPTSSKPGDRAIVTLDGVMYGWIGGSCAHPTVVREARRAIAEDRSVLVRLSPEPAAERAQDGVTQVPMTCFSGGTLDVYIEPQQPQPRLIVVGYLPVAQSLIHLGKAMNYRVLVVAPAEEAASVSHADAVRTEPSALREWINALSFVVVATHGNGDEEALEVALGAGAPYVGLVASRSRAKAVLENLAAAGVSPGEIARIKVPAGLDIQARHGDEIALSIMAEIVQRRRNLEALAWEAPGPSEASRASEPAPVAAIDPVCGMTVKTATAKHSAVHEGTRYYFCCAGCRGRFVANPGSYISATPTA